MKTKLLSVTLQSDTSHMDVISLPANTAGIKPSSQSSFNTCTNMPNIFKYFKGELVFHLITSPLSL